MSLTEATDPKKLPYETYRIGRSDYLVLCKYLSPWFVGEHPEDLANALFDVRMTPSIVRHVRELGVSLGILYVEQCQ